MLLLSGRLVERFLQAAGWGWLVKNHLDGVFNGIGSGVTNARIEGLNTMITSAALDLGVRVAMERKPCVFESFRGQLVRAPELHLGGL